MDWSRLPAKFAIKFNPRREEYPVVKGLIAGALGVWAAAMCWMLAIGAFGGAGPEEVLISVGWVVCSGTCWWQFMRRVIM